MIKPDRSLAWMGKGLWGPTPGCWRGKVSFRGYLPLADGSRSMHVQAALSGLGEFTNRMHGIGRGKWWAMGENNQREGNER